MNQDELTALFDHQAAGYESQWSKTLPIRNCLHLLMGSVFAELPNHARVLCVGAGTGAELAYLALTNAHLRFTAVEPSGAMLAICRQLAEEAGFAARCEFHQGYVESLSFAAEYDAATCFLVSQFIIDQDARSGLFRELSRRLKAGGILASADLACDTASAEYEVLLRAWMNMMAAADISAEGIDRMRKAFANDVAVLAPTRVASIIESGGFEPPVQFFQAGLIHGWLSKRALSIGA